MNKILILTIVLLLIGCSNYSTKEPLRELNKKYDPSALKLKQGYNSYVQNTHLEDGTEIGIIYLKDGSYAKYWFRSHHLVDDIGGTWFLMSDGQKEYMAGCFCCEVQLPENQPSNLKDLKRLIDECHGLKP